MAERLLPASAITTSTSRFTRLVSMVVVGAAFDAHARCHARAAAKRTSIIE